MGFVLQFPEAAHVRYAVLQRLDVPEEHRRVAVEPRLVNFAVRFDPFVSGFLAAADFVAHALHQNFRASSGERVESGVLEVCDDFRERTL